ncbi:DUF4870 family protein [Neisseria perflava]|uniref:DUF4870 family protein n=1 Tax=Neisseria perflava TaxID=33053 RepID=UPI00209F9CC6|nr:hypothetical protein [Neisseria perflava]MCP1659602.1 putative membrane protein [Neisseria perflava]
MNEIIEHNAPQPDNRRMYMMVIYGLYALSLLVGFSSVVGVILAYVKREDMRNSLYENHITYLIRTFWLSLAGYVIGGLTIWLGVGAVVLFIVSIWFIYRVVAGFVKLYDGKTVVPDGWL